MPSAMAISVYNQIIEHGKVTRGSIGVSFTEDQSKNPIVLHDLGAPYGMVLQSVEPGSPADKAGLRAGDVVTAINGHAVKNGNDLVNPVAQTPIGGNVRVSYMRSKQSHEATLTVEDRAKLFPDRASSDAQSPEPDSGKAAPAEFGLQVQELTPDRARRGNFGDNHGILVVEVAPVSFAEDVGLMRGDLIAEINHVAVTSMNGYRQSLMALKPGQEVVFKVLRHADADRILTVLLAGTMPAAQR